MDEPGVGVDQRPGTQSRYGLAAFMVGAGITHFVAPGFYERIVPKWFGHEQATVRWSGVAEVLCGALVALPATKRFGAWLTVVVLLVVYPANIQMAVDAGKPGNAEEWVAWVRLPLQLPLLRWAYRHAR